jgi:hypothetical protein
MFKKFFRKVRETVKKVAPIAAPLAGLAFGAPMGMGLGALMGQYGGKKGALQGALLGGLGGLFNNPDGSGNLLSKLYGNVAGPAIGGSPGKMIEGRGLAGAIQNLLGGEAGELGIAKLLQGNLGKYGLPALIGMFTKNQLDDQDMSKADINAYRSLSDIKNDSVFGGSPFLKDRFQGLAYDPAQDKSYDYITKDGEYKDFTVDDDGRIIEDMQISTGFNKGGIAALNFGGAPHRMSFAVNQKPVLSRAVGGEIFDPSMTGGQMMNEIKENPGITQYFPPKFGEITGPGGPKDDKIPAMLSDGEFVMTAKAVDNAGGPKAMYNLMNKLDPESSKGKGIMS